MVLEVAVAVAVMEGDSPCKSGVSDKDGGWAEMVQLVMWLWWCIGCGCALVVVVVVVMVFVVDIVIVAVTVVLVAVFVVLLVVTVTANGYTIAMRGLLTSSHIIGSNSSQ
jgi:hypothetical protein